MKVFKRYIKELCCSLGRQIQPNSIQLSDGEAAKFSMGIVYLTESGEVIGKYRRRAADKYIVESGGEYAGTLLPEGDVCRIISCTGVVYTAKRNAVKDSSGTRLAWFNGDAVGAAAAFLCLR